MYIVYMGIFAYWWVIAVALVSFLSAFFTVKSNTQGGIWVFIVLISSISPAWAWITRISTDIVFDSFIYDITTSISYTIALLYFSHSFHKFTGTQYVAMVIILFGMLLFKRGF